MAVSGTCVVLVASNGAVQAHKANIPTDPNTRNRPAAPISIVDSQPSREVMSFGEDARTLRRRSRVASHEQTVLAPRTSVLATTPHIAAASALTYFALDIGRQWIVQDSSRILHKDRVVFKIWTGRYRVSVVVVPTDIQSDVGDRPITLPIHEIVPTVIDVCTCDKIGGT